MVDVLRGSKFMSPLGNVEHLAARGPSVFSSSGSEVLLQKSACYRQQDDRKVSAEDGKAKTTEFLVELLEQGASLGAKKMALDILMKLMLSKKSGELDKALHKRILNALVNVESAVIEHLLSKLVDDRVFSYKLSVHQFRKMAEGCIKHCQGGDLGVILSGKCIFTEEEESLGNSAICKTGEDTNIQGPDRQNINEDVSGLLLLAAKGKDGENNNVNNVKGEAPVKKYKGKKDEEEADDDDDEDVGGESEDDGGSDEEDEEEEEDEGGNEEEEEEDDEEEEEEEVPKFNAVPQGESDEEDEESESQEEGVEYEEESEEGADEDGDEDDDDDDDDEDEDEDAGGPPMKKAKK